MKKRITRRGKTIIAEVFREMYFKDLSPDNRTYEVIVDYKEFNNSLWGLIAREPTDETYRRANKWANNVIYLHKKHTDE
jgi:hypothetical protein